MANFDENDPKYRTCCCGAHITKLARALFIIDLVSVLCACGLMLIIPGLIAGICIYLLIQCRPSLLIYAILGVTINILWILAAMFILSLLVSADLFLTDASDNSKIAVNVTNLNGNKIRLEAPKTMLYVVGSLCVIGIAIKVFFIYVYWRMCKFIKDREMGQGTIPSVFSVKA